MSDKLKEVANHTRQFTKKKRIQFNDVSENSNSNFLRQRIISESSKHTRIEDDLSLQEQLVNDTADIAGSKTNTCHLEQCSDSENLFTSESSFMSNLSQIFLNQLTPTKETNASRLHNDEQVTPPNQDVSESKLYQSTPVEQNKKDKQRSCDTYDHITSSELESSATDPVLCQDSEQSNKKSSPSPPTLTSTATMTTTSTTTTSTMTTTTMIISTTSTTSTTTTTATTMMMVKTIAPYESILSHLKISRWVSLFRLRLSHY